MANVDDLTQILAQPPDHEFGWLQLVDGAFLGVEVSVGLYAVADAAGVLFYIGRSERLRHRISAFLGCLITGADDPHAAGVRGRDAGLRPQEVHILIYKGRVAWEQEARCIAALRPALNVEFVRGRSRGKWEAPCNPERQRTPPAVPVVEPLPSRSTDSSILWNAHAAVEAIVSRTRSGT